MGEYMDQNLPTVSIVSPTSTTGSTSSTVTLSYTSTEYGNQISNFWVRLDSGQWINNGVATSRVFTNVADGFHTFTLIAMDTYDINSATVQVTFSVSTGGSGTTVATTPAAVASTGAVVAGGTGGGPVSAPAVSVADVQNPDKVVAKTDYARVESTTSEGLEVSRKAAFQEVKLSGGSGTAPGRLST